MNKYFIYGFADELEKITGKEKRASIGALGKVLARRRGAVGKILKPSSPFSANARLRAIAQQPNRLPAKIPAGRVLTRSTGQHPLIGTGR